MNYPTVKVGEWVVITEDGIWTTDGDSWSFKSKADAIWEVSCSTMDARKTPKVKRIRSGKYEYYPKDCDYGTFGQSYTIQKVDEDNLEWVNGMIKDQIDDDPLSYNEE